VKLPFHWIDAFCDGPFTGNPAGVVPLGAWLDDRLMQAVAAENNLSETAFFVPEGAGYRLRWFSPTVEVELCGHATLAAGHVVMTVIDPARDSVAFETLSGRLGVTREGDWRVLDFPSRPPVPIPVADWLAGAIGVRPAELHEASGNLLAVLGVEGEVRGLKVDVPALTKGLGPRGLIVTAPGADVDFVSRYFAPNHGILEDPVTGSAHCTLAPYWAGRLGKATLEARQVSARGGRLRCTVKGSRVDIAGRCANYLSGTIEV